ncbi:MAG: CoA transferase, partial [Alphaproteobacteria bacterium]|nr:CoA transferase [Alphaproteobacteria bacterium]
GADVIKVESPGVGDLVRRLGVSKEGITATFATTNRNKRSIVLDLKQAHDREAFERLVATADVVVQNFRPGVAERMGIGEPDLRRLRPDLVYVSISGFGETGPYAHKRVYDPIVQALSGLATIQGNRGAGRPAMCRLIIPDKITAITAAQAITAALLARERTGEGQHVRLSMIDAMVALAWPEGFAGMTFVGEENDVPRNALAQDLVFETADGYMTAGAVSDS